MIYQKKKLCFLSLVIMCCAFCLVQNATAASAIPAGFSGGDGKNIKSAVVIPYIGDYEKSIDQEYKYISAIWPARSWLGF